MLSRSRISASMKHLVARIRRIAAALHRQPRDAAEDHRPSAPVPGAFGLLTGAGAQPHR